MQETGEDSSAEARRPGGGPHPSSQYVTSLAPSEGPFALRPSRHLQHLPRHREGRARGRRLDRGRCHVSPHAVQSLLSSLKRRCYDLALIGSM